MTVVESKKSSQEWHNYELLMEERPWEFAQNPMLEIITDLEEVCRFEQEKQRTIGVVYKSPFNMLVVDLVKGSNGNLFAYERLLPAVARGAVVSVPVYEGKYVLLRQYRHAMRDFQYAFPRGYAEKNLSAEENVRKELKEELGGTVENVQFLGTVVADSGLSGNRVSVYYGEMAKMHIRSGYEEIEDYVLLTEKEMSKWVQAGKINDGFTLSAYGLHMLSKVGDKAV